MISRFNPIDIRVSFEGKSYQLGDEVSVDLEMSPRREVLIREERIDLVCRMTFSELGRPVPTRTHSPSVVPNVASGYRTAPSEEPVEASETDIYRGSPFLLGRRLRSDSRFTERVVVSVPAELPEKAGGSSSRTAAKLDWTLIASVDVSRARDVTVSVPIDIGYFHSARSPSPAELERRRKEARKAAQKSWDTSRRGERDLGTDSP